MKTERYMGWGWGLEGGPPRDHEDRDWRYVVASQLTSEISVKLSKKEIYKERFFCRVQREHDLAGIFI